MLRSSWYIGTNSAITKQDETNACQPRKFQRNTPRNGWNVRGPNTLNWINTSRTRKRRHGPADHAITATKEEPVNGIATTAPNNAITMKAKNHPIRLWLSFTNTWYMCLTNSSTTLRVAMSEVPMSEYSAVTVCLVMFLPSKQKSRALRAMNGSCTNQGLFDMRSAHESRMPVPLANVGPAMSALIVPNISFCSKFLGGCDDLYAAVFDISAFMYLRHWRLRLSQPSTPFDMI
mmetsp:Transcript_38289/g.107597  ORF Transcript_38289/g.107597 Transcript_38289/m.107597 type:complete len:233 (-) Transcript_38289:153-851(-)